MSELLEALYSPSHKKVACVLIAAGYGIGQEVSRIIPPDRWFTFPVDDMVKLSATREQWREFAAMPIERWPGPDAWARPEAKR